MNELNFCPKCGHETLIWDQEKKWSCSQCNFVLYHNVAGAVAVLITFKDEILFTKDEADALAKNNSVYNELRLIMNAELVEIAV